MKNTNFSKIFLFIFFVLASYSFAQTKTELDTLSTFQLSIPSEVLEYNLNDNFYLNRINSNMFNRPTFQDSTSVWLQARMMAGSFINMQDGFGNTAEKMTSPMLNSYYDSQKLATLKAILGSVQVGAVAYLAYRHIKKYGFLKK